MSIHLTTTTSGILPLYKCRQSQTNTLNLFLSLSSFLPSTIPMKKSGLLAASVAAASATAASLSSSSSSHQDERRGRENNSSQSSSSTEKFAPRFDGLRFIETLVTAHR